MLTEFADISAAAGSTFREKAYRNAVREISKLDYAITMRMLESRKIPGIGAGILEKIREFIQTGRVAELDRLRAHFRASRELGQILGVGPATAKKWIESGILSLSDLRRAVASRKIVLTNMQKYGLIYHEDLVVRIPRAETETIGRYLRTLLIQIDPDIVFEITGSYRRGATTSGDVDIIVSNKRHFDDELLDTLRGMLSKDTNYAATLVAGQERFTFLYRSPMSRRVRQVDVLHVRYGSYFAALLYFTGSYEFNTLMRGIAKKKNYRLNQDGLFRVVGDKLRLIPTRSEREIFVLLGMPYTDPVARV